MPKLRYERLEFDKLQMYFGKPYKIDLENTIGSITVYQPTIGKIVDIGEKRFYSTLNLFIANTTLYRAFLWDIGIDWNVMTDFEMWSFFMLSRKDGKSILEIDDEVIKMLFGDLKFDSFDFYEREIPDPKNEGKTKKEIFLYSEELNIEITEDVYQHFHQYLQEVFNMKPEEKITKSKMLKQMYIDSDKRQAENEKNKKESTSIQTIISTCVNHPGFKYKLKELEEVGVCEFFDSSKRLQVYESATATLRGIMCGLALSGGKGIDPNEYNIMREI